MKDSIVLEEEIENQSVLALFCAIYGLIPSLRSTLIYLWIKADVSSLYSDYSMSLLNLKTSRIAELICGILSLI